MEYATTDFLGTTLGRQLLSALSSPLLPTSEVPNHGASTGPISRQLESDGVSETSTAPVASRGQSHLQSSSEPMAEPPSPHSVPPWVSVYMPGQLDVFTGENCDLYYNETEHWQAMRDIEQRMNIELEESLHHEAVLEVMQDILDKRGSYRALISCRGDKAQRVLGIMQKLLDNQSAVRDDVRRSILVATLRLCTASGTYPQCLTLEDIWYERRPVTSGQFGEIWRGAFQGQNVCLKVIKLYQNSQIQHLMKTFSREAITWSQLAHPNLLPFYGIYHLGDPLGRVCLVSPWMENGNIPDYLKANPEIPRLPLIHDILAGLAHLHEHSIVHGDLKGANILITPDGSACLADFGLSSVVDANILRWTSLETVTHSGGTLRWEAPELIDDADESTVPHPTFSSDVYSLASVMYEVLTGQVPFHEYFRDTTVIFKTMSGIRPTKPPPEVELELSDGIWEIMERCWSHTPASRPSVVTIAERLRRVPFNSLTIRRIGERQMNRGGVTEVFTPSYFRVAVQGGRQSFSSSEVGLLLDLIQP